jgi:hypothetical protein
VQWIQRRLRLRRPVRGLRASPAAVLTTR